MQRERIVYVLRLKVFATGWIRVIIDLPRSHDIYKQAKYFTWYIKYVRDARRAKWKFARLKLQFDSERN